MTNANKMTVRVFKNDTASLAQPKDEEYAYWQSRPPYERLEAMLELSFAFYGAKTDEPQSREEWLRSARCLPCPWSAQAAPDDGDRELEA